MGAWVDRIPELVASIALKNGRYDENTPKMRASDMVALLGVYSSALPSAVKRIAPRIVEVGLATGDGVLLLNVLDSGISVESYLFDGVPSGDGAIAWRRKVTVPDFSPGFHPPTTARAFECARPAALIQDDKTEHIYFLRETIGAYQRGIDQITLALVMYPIGTASGDICKPFMRAVRELAVDLEIMGENPPTSFLTDARGALREARDASAQAAVEVAKGAGEAAAWAGNQAGKIAGAAASGFFSAANLGTLAVAGLVGYIALRRYL